MHILINLTRIPDCTGPLIQMHISHFGDKTNFKAADADGFV